MTFQLLLFLTVRLMSDVTIVFQDINGTVSDLFFKCLDWMSKLYSIAYWSRPAVCVRWMYNCARMQWKHHWHCGTGVHSLELWCRAQVHGSRLQMVTCASFRTLHTGVVIVQLTNVLSQDKEIKQEEPTMPDRHSVNNQNPNRKHLTYFTSLKPLVWNCTCKMKLYSEDILYQKHSS